MLNTYKDEQIPIPEITRHIVESLGGGISPFQLFNPIENLDDIIENELCHVPMLCALPFSKLPLALPKGL